ncbi:MAG: LPP20 family lipoprotein [Candidatus Delongbacteria bacterium]|nr:LPP20 family lipoprotein [Candidatus Delongbacteria bacterium]MBN2833512.1 LPP20 family lipoprotein [Candidatus Delongbacteria bacterium]
MKRAVIIIILSVFIILKCDELKKVSAVGFGSNHEESLNNALKEGLAKVVGMYMSSSSFVQNYQTINDEITSFSNGYIENYNVISTETKDGIVQTYVEVSVKTGILITKLKELNISTIAVLVDTDYVEKDLKMQNITKVNQEKLTEEYYKQIIEPIKLNKSHFIKINNFSVFEITDIPKTHYTGEVLMKNLRTGDMEQFEHNIYLTEDKKYDFMDNYYIIKVNYQIGITDEFYNNCISFMDAAFTKIENKIKLSEVEVGATGGDKVFISKITSIMKTGFADNVYTLDARTLNRFKKYFDENRDRKNYKLSYVFKAFDNQGFPNMNFNYIGRSEIDSKNNIMAFRGAIDPRKQIVQYSKFGKLLDDDRYYFDERELICNGVLFQNNAKDLSRGTFIGERYQGNMYILKDDYGIELMVYLAIPKIKIHEIAEIKAELITE